MTDNAVNHDRRWSDSPLILSPSTMVLVVDDEPGFRNLLEWELIHQGMRVETAVNGREAMRRAEHTLFDVIITDISMPEMNGLELLDTIMRRRERTQVIVTTACSAVETAVRAMELGAFSFVLKPFDLEHLLSRLRNAIQRPPPCKECGR